METKKNISLGNNFGILLVVMKSDLKLHSLINIIKNIELWERLLELI